MTGSLPKMKGDQPLSTHSAPVCYGRQYSDQDQECQRCSWIQACKPEFLSVNGMTPVNQIPAPTAPPQPPWPYPTTTAYPSKAPTLPAPVTISRLPVIQPTVPQPLAAQPVQSIQQPAQSQALVPQQYNPYFQQYYQPYAGERVTPRVTTHIALRMGVTLFSELAKFCEVWRPEPPSGN